MHGSHDSFCASPAIGLALMALGVGTVVTLVFGAAIPCGLVGPLIFAAGAVVLARGLWPDGRLWTEAPLLCMGLVLLLIGAYPWIYTPYLTADRPDGEAAGMLGTFLFIFAGLPGLLLTLAGGLLRLLR